MATAVPVTSWSAEVAITSAVSYDYTITPGAGGYIVMQWSANGTTWFDFENNPFHAVFEGHVPSGAAYIRGHGFGAAGSFDVVEVLALECLFVKNVAAAPGFNPTAGGFLYVENGALKYRGSSGTVTPLAAA